MGGIADKCCAQGRRDCLGQGPAPVRIQEREQSSLRQLGEGLDNFEEKWERHHSPAAGSSSQLPASSSGAAGRHETVQMVSTRSHELKSMSVIPYRSNGRDAELFDIAFKTRDVLTLVELLHSPQRIDTVGQRMHPWAEDPKTVGALAASQLAIIASAADRAKDDEEHAFEDNVKDEIREAGAIPPLVAFLQSAEPDRVQASIVALSFLTAGCELNAAAAYDCGAMPVLLEFTESPITGLRAAAATTLCHMAKVSSECNEEFVAIGGLRNLVAQLDCTAGRGTYLADLQLEAVLNLQDVLELDLGTLNPKNAKKAVELGVVEGLTRLSQAEDKEVRESARELLGDLTEMIGPLAVHGAAAPQPSDARP